MHAMFTKDRCEPQNFLGCLKIRPAVGEIRRYFWIVNLKTSRHQ